MLCTFVEEPTVQGTSPDQEEPRAAQGTAQDHEELPTEQDVSSAWCGRSSSEDAQGGIETHEQGAGTSSSGRGARAPADAGARAPAEAAASDQASHESDDEDFEEWRNATWLPEYEHSAYMGPWEGSQV